MGIVITNGKKNPKKLVRRCMANDVKILPMTKVNVLHYSENSSDLGKFVSLFERQDDSL